MSDPVKCACGEVARFFVFQATKPVTAACVACADRAPFYCTVRRFGPRPGPKSAGRLDFGHKEPGDRETG